MTRAKQKKQGKRTKTCANIECTLIKAELFIKLVKARAKVERLQKRIEKLGAK